MSTGIRIFIEQRKTGPISGNHIIRLVVVRLGNTCKQTFIQRGLRREDVFNTPRRVERFHESRVAVWLWKVKAGGRTLGRLGSRLQPTAQYVDKGLNRQFDKEERLGDKVVSAAHRRTGAAFEIIQTGNEYYGGLGVIWLRPQLG